MSGCEHKPEKYSRVTDKKGFDKNFDQIDWSKKREVENNKQNEEK